MLKNGDISLEQASEIAGAEQSSPGAASELVAAARDGAFHVLRDKARKLALEAEQGRGLAERQHAARSARSRCDALGMVNLHLVLEPQVGTPILNRAEAEAARLQRRAKRQGRPEPFERHLADAYAGLLGANTPGRSRRPSWSWS